MKDKRIVIVLIFLFWMNSCVTSIQKVKEDEASPSSTTGAKFPVPDPSGHILETEKNVVEISQKVISEGKKLIGDISEKVASEYEVWIGKNIRVERNFRGAFDVPADIIFHVSSTSGPQALKEVTWTLWNSDEKVIARGTTPNGQILIEQEDHYELRITVRHVVNEAEVTVTKSFDVKAGPSFLDELRNVGSKTWEKLKKLADEKLQN